MALTRSIPATADSDPGHNVHMSLESYLAQLLLPENVPILVDATEWLGDEAFWPAFLMSVGGSDTAATSFAVDPADVEEYCKVLHDHGRWPFATVHLATGHQAHILFRNYEDDSGWDYLVQSGETGDMVLLAALEGHFRGPGLAWPELLAVANQGATSVSRAQRLLLLLPATADAETPEEAVDTISKALMAVGGEQARAATIASELLEAADRFWGREPAWSRVDGHWVCADVDSPRSSAAPLEQKMFFGAAFPMP